VTGHDTAALRSGFLFFFFLLRDGVGCCYNENLVMKLAWQRGSLAKSTFMAVHPL